MLVSVVFYVWAGGIFHCLGRDFTIGGGRRRGMWDGRTGGGMKDGADWGYLPISEFYAIWVEISNRQLQDSLPISGISAFWVEIHGWQLQDSLPFRQISGQQKVW